MHVRWIRKVERHTTSLPLHLHVLCSQSNLYSLSDIRSWLSFYHCCFVSSTNIGYKIDENVFFVVQNSCMTPLLGLHAKFILSFLSEQTSRQTSRRSLFQNFCMTPLPWSMQHFSLFIFFFWTNSLPLWNESPSLFLSSRRLPFLYVLFLFDFFLSSRRFLRKSCVWQKKKAETSKRYLFAFYLNKLLSFWTCVHLHHCPSMPGFSPEISLSKERPGDRPDHYGYMLPFPLSN